jgi:hypothetical protein
MGRQVLGSERPGTGGDDLVPADGGVFSRGDAVLEGSTEPGGGPTVGGPEVSGRPGHHPHHTKGTIRLVRRR